MEMKKREDGIEADSPVHGEGEYQDRASIANVLPSTRTTNVLASTYGHMRFM